VQFSLHGKFSFQIKVPDATVVLLQPDTPGCVSTALNDQPVAIKIEPLRGF